jgi:hypothetical protein
LFEGTGNVLQESANLFWDNTNNQFSLLTNSDLASSALSGLNVKNSNSTGYANTLWYNNNDDVGQFMMTGTSGAISGTNIIARQANFINAGGTGGINLLATAGNISFLAGSGSTSKMVLFQTGNLAINKTTDDGFKFDVNGTARVQGALTSTSSVNGGFSALIQNTSSGTQGSTALNLANNVATQGGISTYSSTNNTAYLRNNVVLASYPTASNVIIATNFDVASGGTGQIQFKLGGYGGSINSTIFSTGNWGIKTTTDAGFTFDINGTARVSGRMEIQNSSGLNIRTTVGAVSTAFRPSGTGAEIRTNDASVACMFFNQNGIVGFSQRVAFGNTTASAASAQVQIDSTTKGFLPPRMTTTQRNAIASPAAGLIVYDTTLNLPHFFNGTIWVSL